MRRQTTVGPRCRQTQFRLSPPSTTSSMPVNVASLIGSEEQRGISYVPGIPVWPIGHCSSRRRTNSSVLPPYAATTSGACTSSPARPDRACANDQRCLVLQPLAHRSAPDQAGVGASGWSSSASRKSVHNAEGMGYCRSRELTSDSSTLRGPGRMAATAGWASGNWSAAANRGTP